MLAVDERLTSETLDNLVTQFSSVWDFLRELVQNSIDAGSSSVEVWTEFQIEAGESEGVISIHVDDFGEGMNEEIIDDQLTQISLILMRSSYKKAPNVCVDNVSHD